MLYMIPRTGAGWARLLGLALALATAASILGGLNPSGITTFVLALVIGSYFVTAWERRRFTGQGGIPSPLDALKEPFRSGMAINRRFANTPYQTQDRVLSLGVGLIAIPGMVLFSGVYLLGSIQTPVLLGLMGAGAVVTVSRYLHRGKWR